MNIINNLFNKSNLEYELDSMIKDNKKLMEELKRHEKWQKGYLEHITSLENELKELKKEKENLKYKKLLTNKYLGTINIEFISKNPHEYMQNLVSDIIKNLEKANMCVTEYSFTPQELSYSSYFGRRKLLNETSSFEQDYLLMMHTINDLEYDLETICMYGDNEDFQEQIKKIKEVINETTQLRRQLIEE